MRHVLAMNRLLRGVIARHGQWTPYFSAALCGELVVQHTLYL
jgi:hypothetical protein